MFLLSELMEVCNLPAIGEDEGGGHGLQENLFLTQISFKLLLLGKSSLRVPPQFPDNVDCSELGVEAN